MALKIQRPAKRKGMTLTQIPATTDELTIETLRQMAREHSQMDGVKRSMGSIIKALVINDKRGREIHKQLNRKPHDDTKYMDIKK